MIRTGIGRRIRTRIALLAILSVVASLGLITLAGPATAATFTGGFSPNIIGGLADLNGDGVVTGRDDASAFYGDTHIIDGGLDCDAWGATANAGTGGSGVISSADDCTLVGYDGTSDGVTILVEDGVFGWTGRLPTVFNASDPDNPDVGDSDFAWSTIDGRVDSNGNEAIGADDCHFGLIGQTVDVGLGDATDGADILGSDPGCGFATPPPSVLNGYVDLNSDETITAADTCTNNCFFGHDVDNGLVQEGAVPPTFQPVPPPGPRIDVFSRGSAGQLLHWWFTGVWSGPEDLGGVLASGTGPSAASWESGRLDVFLMGTDGQLWHKWFEGTWSPWEPLGGALAGSPDAVSWGDERIDVFVRGTDNQLWHRWYEGAWFGYEPLGGVLAGGPGVSSWAPGRLDVFVRGADNQLWHRWYEGAWFGYEPLGGVVTADPDATSWDVGRIDAFVRGGDNQLWHRWYEAGWFGYEPLGGVLAGGPGACSFKPGRLDIFVRGTDNQLWHRWYEAGWFGYESLDGTLTGDPDCVSWDTGN